MAISKHADIVCKLHRVITDLLKKEAAAGRRLLAAAAVSSHSIVRVRAAERNNNRQWTSLRSSAARLVPREKSSRFTHSLGRSQQRIYNK